MPGQDHNPRKRRLYLPIVPEIALVRKGIPGVGYAQAPVAEGPAGVSPNHAELTSIMRGLDLHTVCEEAMCPNIGGVLGGARGDVLDPGR
jgi:hypothetical protein